MTRPPIHRSFLNLFTNKSWIFHPQVYSLKIWYHFYIHLVKHSLPSLINCHLHFKLPHLKLFVGMSISRPDVGLSIRFSQHQSALWSVEWNFGPGANNTSPLQPLNVAAISAICLLTFKGQSIYYVIQIGVPKDLAHSCTRFPCYLGMEINQCRDPMNNNKDCRVGQLTKGNVNGVSGYSQCELITFVTIIANKLYSQ